MSDVLVAYYSTTGHTAQAAKDIARRLHGDLERIIPRAPRRTSMFSMALAALLRRKDDVLPPAKDPADYRIVVIATPVWAGSLPPPVRGYLAQVRGRIKAAGFVATSSSANARGALKALRGALGREPIADVTISDVDRRSGQDAAKLATFADALRRQQLVA